MTYDYQCCPPAARSRAHSGRHGRQRADAHSPRRRRRGRLAQAFQGRRTARCSTVEFVVVDGPYARRKFWSNFVLAGTTAGHAQAAEISRGVLRSILESARGIRPDDLSEQARARRTADLKDFDNIIFIARIGIEKGKPKNDGSGENYADKNVIAAVITPDKKEWHPIDAAAAFRAAATVPARPHRLLRPATLVLRARPPKPAPGSLNASGRATDAANRPVAKPSIEDAWQRQATAAAIAAARGVVNPDGPIPPRHSGRPAERHRMGLDRRRDPVRLDFDAGAAGDRGESRRRANHPDDRLEPDPWNAGAVMAILPELAKAARHRLVEAACELAERNHGRVPAQRHAAHPQGRDRARHERQGHHQASPAQARSRAKPTPPRAGR